MFVAGIPIGPSWLGASSGADSNCRHVAGDCSTAGALCEIGFTATLITMILATLIGVSAGYFRGAVDGVLSRVLDVLWAFPVVLLGVALGVALATTGLNFGLFSSKATR